MASIHANSVVDLRAELKQWEKDFALANNGRKPSREDIKKDSSIAEKYSRFNRHTRPRATPQKPRRPALEERTLNIPAIPTPVTCKSKHVEEVEPTPAHIRCALGPTPQKDGFVLGIFDLFAVDSPSKAVAATPSKLDQTYEHAELSRTPASSSKRFYLDAFAGTPLKRKADADQRTPASAKRQQLTTPAFLRRESTLTEDDTSLFPMRKPGARRGMARCFSDIIAGLRQQENERMDEEWDILRELEAEDEEAAVVKESQGVEMPLGPDEAPLSDEEEPDPADANRKVWKKKGLKRQTKKVNMKPVLHAPQKAVESAAEEAPAQESIVKKTLRKVNEAAHMNFRRLKIKNKNSKAKGRGRFGKR